MDASAWVTSTPMPMATPIMNKMFLPATSNSAAMRHNPWYRSTKCCHNLSLANHWWCPSLCTFLRADVVPRHKPKWLSHISLCHVV